MKKLHRMSRPSAAVAVEEAKKPGVNAKTDRAALKERFVDEQKRARALMDRWWKGDLTEAEKESLPQWFVDLVRKFYMLKRWTIKVDKFMAFLQTLTGPVSSEVTQLRNQVIDGMKRLERQDAHVDNLVLQVTSEIKASGRKSPSYMDAANEFFALCQQYYDQKGEEGKKIMETLAEFWKGALERHTTYPGAEEVTTLVVSGWEEEPAVGKKAKPGQWKMGQKGKEYSPEEWAAIQKGEKPAAAASGATKTEGVLDRVGKAIGRAVTLTVAQAVSWFKRIAESVTGAADRLDDTVAEMQEAARAVSPDADAYSDEDIEEFVAEEA